MRLFRFLLGDSAFTDTPFSFATSPTCYFGILSSSSPLIVNFNTLGAALTLERDRFRTIFEKSESVEKRTSSSTFLGPSATSLGFSCTLEVVLGQRMLMQGKSSYLGEGAISHLKGASLSIVSEGVASSS